MAVRSFTVVYERAEGGGFYAHVPALDLTTEGRTLKEAKAMARDAIGGYLEAAKILAGMGSKIRSLGRLFPI